MDHYWRAVLAIKSYSGEPKYTLLGTLVKSVLSLYLGNVAVERSLSDNKNTLSPLCVEPVARNSHWVKLNDRVCSIQRRRSQYCG